MTAKLHRISTIQLALLPTGSEIQWIGSSSIWRLRLRFDSSSHLRPLAHLSRSQARTFGDWIRPQRIAANSPAARAHAPVVQARSFADATLLLERRRVSSGLPSPIASHPDYQIRWTGDDYAWSGTSRADELEGASPTAGSEPTNALWHAHVALPLYEFNLCASQQAMPPSDRVKGTRRWRMT